MVRNIKYDHNKVVTGTDDATKQVSKDAWNDGHNEIGMSGHGTVTTLTITTGSISPINDMHKVDGEGATADNLDSIINTDTAEFDEVWLLGGAQTITLRDNSVSAGNIFTLSGISVVLSTTVPTKIIRVGTNWHEVGAGSQTPWVTDIDADGFDLNDLSNIEFRTSTGAPAGTVQAIWADAGGININVPTGDNLDIQVNAVSEYNFDVTQADFNLNNIVDTGNIGVGTTTPATVSGLDISAGTDIIGIKGAKVNQALNIEGSQAATIFLIDSGGVANDKVFTIVNDAGSTELEILNDNLTIGQTPISINMASGAMTIGTTMIMGAQVLQFNDANTSLQQSSSDLQIDVATAGSVDIRINNVVEYDFGAASITMNSNNLNMQNGSIFFADTNTSMRTTGTTLEIDVDSGDNILFRVADVNEYQFNATQADWNNNALVNLLDPVNAQDGATKNYVDGLVQGTVKWKEPVIVATTVNITLSGEQTIDGVLTSADRILVKDQTLGQENGIYVTAAGTWTRATDFDVSTEVVNGAMWVGQGTTNADQAFVMTTDAPITIGTTPMVFIQFSGLGQITAGTNLSKTANTLNWDPIGSVDFLANNLTNMGVLQFNDSDNSIQQSGPVLQIDSATGGNVIVRFNNVDSFQFGRLASDWKGLDMNNMGILNFANTNTSIQQVSANLQLDVATGGQHVLRVNNVNEFQFTNSTLGMNLNTISNSGGITIASGDMDIPSGSKYKWGNTSDRAIDNDTTGTTFRVQTADNFTFRIGASDEYIFDNAQADFLGNNLVGVQNIVHDISTSGTDIDFNEDELQTISIAVNTTFTTANRVAGRSKTLKITTDATLRTLTFPAWDWVSDIPADQAASKNGYLTLTCYGTTDALIVAAYQVGSL